MCLSAQKSYSRVVFTFETKNIFLLLWYVIIEDIWEKSSFMSWWSSWCHVIIVLIITPEPSNKWEQFRVNCGTKTDVLVHVNSITVTAHLIASVVTCSITMQQLLSVVIKGIYLCTYGLPLSLKKCCTKASICHHHITIMIGTGCAGMMIGRQPTYEIKLSFKQSQLGTRETFQEMARGNYAVVFTLCSDSN